MGDTTKLESQLAFLEDTVRALDTALAAQQQQILRLEERVEVMRQQLKEQGARLDAATEAEADTPPPHY